MQCYETWTVDWSINRKGRPVTEKYKENEQLILCGVYLLLHIYIYILEHILRMKETERRKWQDS